MRKLLSLLTLLVAVVTGAWAQDVEILNTNFTQWKEGAKPAENSGLNAKNTYTLTDGTNDVASVVGSGCKLNDSSNTPTATGITGYNTNKFRFGSSSNYLTITPTEKVYAGGKVRVLVSSEQTNTTKVLGTVKIGETLLGTLYAWSAKATCDWQEFDIPASFNNQKISITLTRTDNTMFVWGVVVKTNDDVSYTVTYKAGEGTGDDVVESTLVVGDCPATFTAPTGKSFVDWNTESDGTGTSYAVGALVSSNLTLYAQWAAKYSVTYDLGAGTGTIPTQVDLPEDATFTVAAAPADLVAPTGKEFKCWNDGTNDYNAGATYTMGTSNVTLTAVYQDRTYHGLTPSATLDLSDATNATFTTTWYTSNNMIKNSMYDAANGVVVFSPYAIYQKNPSWSAKDGSGSTSDTWTATGVFQGSSYYFSSSPKVAGAQPTRIYYYRVTNCTGVSALMTNKGVMEVYEIVAGVVSADPTKSEELASDGTLTFSGLDASKEYIIRVYGNNGGSNILFKEIAFNFPAVATQTVSTLAGRNYASYVTTQKLDFGNASGITAYIAEGLNGAKNAVVLNEVDIVPAGTPIIVKTDTQGASVDVNVTTADADEVSANKLVAGDGTTSATADASTTYYYLASDKFHQATSGTLQSGKAYLKLTSSTPAPELNITVADGDDISTGIDNIKANDAQNGEVYNLNGQRIAQPTKGLYIVNGKKIIIK